MVTRLSLGIKVSVSALFQRERTRVLKIISASDSKKKILVQFKTRQEIILQTYMDLCTSCDSDSLNAITGMMRLAWVR